MRAERDIVITIATILLLVLVGFILVWLPQHRERIALTEARHELAWALRDQAAMDVDLPREIRIVDDLRAALRRDNRHVPAEANLGELLREISSALRAQQVLEHETQTRPPQDIDSYQVAPLSLTFNGSFPAVYGLIDHVESLPRLVRVTKLSIAAAPEHQGTPLRVRVDMAAFYGHGKEGR